MALASWIKNGLCEEIRARVRGIPRAAFLFYDAYAPDLDPDLDPLDLINDVVRAALRYDDADPFALAGQAARRWLK